MVGPLRAPGKIPAHRVPLPFIENTAIGSNTEVRVTITTLVYTPEMEGRHFEKIDRAAGRGTPATSVSRVLSHA